MSATVEAHPPVAASSPINVAKERDVSKDDDVKKEQKVEEGGDKKPHKMTLKVFRFCSAADYLLLTVGIGCNIGNGILLPAFMLVFGDLIDTIGGAPVSGGKSYEYYVSLQAILGGVSFVVSWLGATCVEWAAERQLRRMREEYLVAIMRQEQGWFDTFDSGTLSSRLNENSIQIRDGIGVKFGQIFMFVSMFIAGLAVGFIKGWKLALVITAVMPLIAAAAYFMMLTLTTAGETARVAYRDAGAVAEESFSSIRTVVAFGAEKKSVARYVECLERGMGKLGVFVQGMGMGTVMGVMFMTYGLGFWYGGVLVAEDIESGCNAAVDTCFQGGDALTVFFCVLISAFVIGQAGPNATAFSKGSAAAADLFELMDRKSSIDPLSTEGVRDVPLKGDVVFKKVKFAYPSRTEKPVFDSLDLNIPAGQTVALVGASGCGKSTTIQLVERFYDVTEGSVTIDGRDVRDYNVNWLRSQISIVSQEPKLFADSIAENIRYGRLDATRQQIEEAAKNSNAHKFISEFPDGYNTLVGESGGQLSGGQKQRVAIARAIIRDPKILILDEATSALDNESEKIVQQTLDDLLKQTKRTTIIVAHRLTTIRNVDRIIVLDNTSGDGATVVEQGTHDELMRIENGIYFNLVNSQNVSIADQTRMDTVNRLSQEFGVARKSSSRALSKIPSFVSSARELSLRHSRIGSIAEEHGKEAEIETKTVCGCIKVKKSPPNKKPAPSYFRVLKKLKQDWWKLLCGVIGAVINGSIFPIFGIIFAKFVGVYFLTDPNEIRDDAKFWAGMFVVLGVGAFVGMSMQTLFFEWAGQRLMREMREDLFDSILHQDIAFFDDPENSTGSLSQLLSSDVVLIKGWVSDNTGIFLSNMCALAFAIAIAFAASPELAAVVLAAFFIMAPASYLEMQSMKGSTETTSAAAETPGTVMNETISNISIVTAFCLQEEMHKNYMEVLQVAHTTGVKNAVVFGFFFGFSQFAQFGVQALSYWYGSKLLEEGKIDNVEKMMMAIFALIFAAMGFGQSAVFATDSSKAKQAGRNVYYVLDRVPKIDVRNPDGETFETLNGKVNVDKVNFRYPQRPDVPVYKNLSFDVKEGETVALVGASGCGKSTVIQLLERFYDVMSSPKGREGAISIDGLDVRDFNLKYLRSQIGLVSQEPILFNTSIKDNILYGRDTATMEEVTSAAKMANAHDFIMSFPDGYDTIVGKGGGQLSGGQKQRISIARAMIRDPKILLLDEATSALDAESEKIVQSALDNLLTQKKRTTIVIAHRLSTVRNADKIVVLINEDQQGSIVTEVGNHQTLLAIPDGVYANLIKIATAAGDTGN